MLFSATYKDNILPYIDKNNFYQFASGAVNEVSAAVRQNFWQCNTKISSRIYGAVLGKTIIRSYADGEIQHPFDLLYFFIRDVLFKKSKKKNVMVFVKKTCMADMIAQKLKLHGFDAIAIHGLVFFPTNFLLFYF